MLKKPRGVVTSAADEKGRETVYGFLSAGTFAANGNLPREVLLWVAPVGRLDKASEGLLFLTNDSEWGAHIAAQERIWIRPTMSNWEQSPMRISYRQRYST